MEEGARGRAKSGIFGVVVIVLLRKREDKDEVRRLKRSLASGF